MEISAKRLELVEELFVRVAKSGVDLLMGNKGDNKEDCNNLIRLI